MCGLAVLGCGCRFHSALTCLGSLAASGGFFGLCELVFFLSSDGSGAIKVCTDLGRWRSLVLFAGGKTHNYADEHRRET